MEASIATVVETSSVADAQLGIVQAGVVPHHGPRGVPEDDFGDLLEGVVDELGAVGRRELDAL